MWEVAFLEVCYERELAKLFKLSVPNYDEEQRKIYLLIWDESEPLQSDNVEKARLEARQTRIEAVTDACVRCRV